MKKRTVFIGAILSLISLGQPLIIKNGAVLSTTRFLLFVPEKVYAGDNSYYFDRAFEKGENGDYYGAISDYTKAIEINPIEADVYNNRGNVKVALKDYYGAISDYTKAIEMNPNYSKAYSNRGITKKAMGDIQGACSDWEKASSLGNDTAAKLVRDKC